MEWQGSSVIKNRENIRGTRHSMAILRFWASKRPGLPRPPHKDTCVISNSPQTPSLITWIQNIVQTHNALLPFSSAVEGSYSSTRTINLEAWMPPWCRVFSATTVIPLLYPARVLLLGKIKFSAPDVTVTRIRWPLRKQLDSFVVLKNRGCSSQ